MASCAVDPYFGADHMDLWVTLNDTQSEIHLPVHIGFNMQRDLIAGLVGFQGVTRCGQLWRSSMLYTTVEPSPICDVCAQQQSRERAEAATDRVVHEIRDQLVGEIRETLRIYGWNHDELPVSEGVRWLGERHESAQGALEQVRDALRSVMSESDDDD